MKTNELAKWPDKPKQTHARTKGCYNSFPGLGKDGNASAQEE